MNVMKMAVVVGALVAGVAGQAQAEDLLTGDARSACEAVLCLSMGNRPDECSASIRRYFSIRADKPSELREKRRNFHEMCPGAESDLVNSIVNGQCNPQYQECGNPGGPGDPYDPSRRNPILIR